MRRRGFNLIELMVVVAVIAFAASFAYSSYKGHIVRSRGAQVQPCITDAALRLENYRSNYGRYPTETGTNLLSVLGVDLNCGEYYQGSITISGNRFVIFFSDTQKPISSKGSGADAWAIVDNSPEVLHVASPIGTVDTWPTGYSSSGYSN